MTQKEVELLYGYIFRNYTRLEQEMHQRQAQMRYTECDTVQCLEAACAIERFNLGKCDGLRDAWSDIQTLLDDRKRRLAEEENDGFETVRED